MLLYYPFTDLCWRQKGKNFRYLSLRCWKMRGRRFAINWFTNDVQVGIIVAEHINQCKCIKGPSIKYVRKIFRKNNISNPLIRTRTCAYQWVRNVIFSENFAHVLNGWPLSRRAIKRTIRLQSIVIWKS